jgi:hypothetical protein
MTIDWVIQESSPDSEKIASPGSSVISRTGMVVPMIRSCIRFVLRAVGVALSLSRRSGVGSTVDAVVRRNTRLPSAVFAAWVVIG